MNESPANRTIDQPFCGTYTLQEAPPFSTRSIEYSARIGQPPYLVLSIMRVIRRDRRRCSETRLEASFRRMVIRE
jgi:hypothetical protein